MDSNLFWRRWSTSPNGLRPFLSEITRPRRSPRFCWIMSLVALVWQRSCWPTKARNSDAFLKLCKALDIRKIRTSSYRASTNGMIERFHRTLNQMQGKVVIVNQRDWDEHVPAAVAGHQNMQRRALAQILWCLAAKSELQLTLCLDHPPWRWNNGQVQMSSLPTFKNVTELLTDWRVNNFESMQIVEKMCTIEKWSNNNSGHDSGYGITTQDGIKAAHRNGPRLI